MAEEDDGHTFLLNADTEQAALLCKNKVVKTFSLKNMSAELVEKTCDETFKEHLRKEHYVRGSCGRTD